MNNSKKRLIKRIALLIIGIVLLVVIAFFTYVLFFGYGQEIFGIVWFG